MMTSYCVRLHEKCLQLEIQTFIGIAFVMISVIENRIRIGLPTETALELFFLLRATVKY